MLKTKTCVIIAAVLIIIYAGLAGAGAYLQYEARNVFFEITGGKDSASVDLKDPVMKALSDKRLMLIDMTNATQKTSRAVLLAISVVFSALLLAAKFPFKTYLISAVGVVIAGWLAIAPFWLMSGIGHMNYYLEQAVVSSLCAIIIVVTVCAHVVIRLVAKKKAA